MAEMTTGELVRLRERLLGYDEGMTDLRDDEIAILEDHAPLLTDHELAILVHLAAKEDTNG